MRVVLEYLALMICFFLINPLVSLAKETYTGQGLQLIQNYSHPVYRHMGLVTQILPDGSRIECGGILIGPRSVLTQATCLTLPLGFPIQAMTQEQDHPNNSFLYLGSHTQVANAKNIYFTPGYRAPGISLHPPRQAQELHFANPVDSQGNYAGEDVGLLVIDEDMGIGFTPILDQEEFDQIPEGELYFLGHIINMNSGHYELWQDSLSFQRSGLKWVFAGDTIAFAMPTFENSRGVFALMSIARQWHIIGLQVGRDDIFKICFRCQRETKSRIQFFSERLYQQLRLKIQ